MNRAEIMRMIITDDLFLCLFSVGLARVLVPFHVVEFVSIVFHLIDHIGHLLIS